MSVPQNCFVIIGYGKKPSYANNRLRNLDLDQTYKLLIKPVFKDLGIDCYRAIDKNVNGSIDKMMLEEIKKAEFALVDLSTLNPNVMWELGVRHALKPHHTIMICEKVQLESLPFDIRQFVVHAYTHSEEGIPYIEVDRFREYLTGIIAKLQQDINPKPDSPIFTFLENEAKTGVNTRSMTSHTSTTSAGESFVSIMEKAEAAKKNKDFDTALTFFAKAKTLAEQNMSVRDNLPLIVSREALCTYKAKQPNELEAYVKAKLILEELNPLESLDTEVLGLSGSIQKRLFELTGDEKYLEEAIAFYEKGFSLKKDYYNGINTAFMIYQKAANLKAKEDIEWEDIKVEADAIRNRVLKISLKMIEEETYSAGEKIWILLTIAEAYNYKGREEEMKKYEDLAEEHAVKTNDSFAMHSYREQKAKIKELLNPLAI